MVKTGGGGRRGVACLRYECSCLSVGACAAADDCEIDAGTGADDVWRGDVDVCGWMKEGGEESRMRNGSKLNCR